MSTISSGRPARRRAWSPVVLTTLAALVALLFVVPLWWGFSASTYRGNEIFGYVSPLEPRGFLPLAPNFANYQVLIDSGFLRNVLNSLWVSGVTVVVGLVICSLAAFGLAAFKFRGQGALFSTVVLSFLIPFDAIAIPLSTLFRDWGLANTYTGLILPGLGNGFAIFLLRQFFLGIPRELLEAARVDGLGWFGIYARIYLPLSKPALIGAGLMLFLSQWQAYLWPLLLGTDPSHQLAPIALANLKGQLTVNYGAILAGSMVLTAIPLLLMLRYQRHFTQSLAQTGIKD